MGTRTGTYAAVILSILLVFSGGGVVAGDGVTAANPLLQLGQYKVSVNDVTVRTWALRNTTVNNATVDEVHVRTLRTESGPKKNVTLRNVSIATVHIQNGTMKNVTADRIVIRNRSIWNVPGGDLFDPGVKNRVIERHVLTNITVEGANLDTLNVDTLTVVNTTVPNRSDAAPVSPDVTDPDTKPKPAVEIQNASIDSGIVRKANAGEWSATNVRSQNATR
ncbi:hypothetical protein [Haladaptatus sp. CMAA 1911]|uniref:hypothetical protein n=1 Tax=unclassified Haladaptatus TaxID=2622732 RepID=UPI00375503B2